MAIGEICSRDVAYCAPNASIAHVAELMRSSHVGTLVVADVIEGRLVPVGIITDRDIVLEVVAPGLDPGALTAGEIMRTELLTATEDDGLAETLADMRRLGVRRVPVVDARGTLVGILSADDILDLLAEELQAVSGLMSRELRKERETRR